MEQLVRIIEALLFCADGPLTESQIQEVVPEADPADLRAAMAKLREQYSDGKHGFGLVTAAGGHQFLTRGEMAPWVEKFLIGRRRQRLSRAALEVLAIIAYRQPLTRGDIEAIRGVDCGGVMHTLLDRRLVAVRGRARRIGHPLLYITTDRFLEHFGIQDLAELPKLEEFRALLDRDAAHEELRAQGVLPIPAAGTSEVVAAGDAAAESATADDDQGASVAAEATAGVNESVSIDTMDAASAGEDAEPATVASDLPWDEDPELVTADEEAWETAP